MNIGELSKRTGLSTSRIRFYEQQGLLQEAERAPNGYRTYRAEMVQVLKLIAVAQSVGFSLDEIGALLPPGLKDWEHGAVIAALQQKLPDIEAQERALAHSKAQLTALLAEVDAKPDGMSCQDNARRVMVDLWRQLDAASAPQTQAGDQG